jgi:hypothetical protein
MPALALIILAETSERRTLRQQLPAKR